MKVGDFVTPETDQEYNTMKFGQKYPVLKVDNYGNFHSENEIGSFYSLFKNDSHLHGKNWKLIPMDPPIQISTGVENGIIVNTTEAMNYINNLQDQIKALTNQ